MRSPDNYFMLISVCFHEAKQKIQSSNLFWSWLEALILPPLDTQKWIVFLQDKRRRAGAGVGESSQMDRITFFLHPVPPCSSWAQNPDLAVEGNMGASELLWFQETQNSLCSDGVCLPLLSPTPSLSHGEWEVGWPHGRLKAMRMELTWT